MAISCSFPPFSWESAREGGIADTISHCSSYCEKKKKGGRAKKAFFFREKVVLAIEHIFPALLRGRRVLLRTRVPPPLLRNRCQQQSPEEWRRNRQSSHSHSADCRQRFFGRPPWTVGRGPDTFINRVARLRFLCGAGLINLQLTRAL